MKLRLHCEGDHGRCGLAVGLPYRSAMALAQAAASAAPAAAAAAAPVANKGDTAWMLTSSVLVLMMSIPGLALFYGGLVRTKNMAVGADPGLHHRRHGRRAVVLLRLFARPRRRRRLTPISAASARPSSRASTPNSVSATFSNGVVIPEYAYLVFQMTFAMITPALIVGAFAERMKFSAVLLFIALG